MKQKLLVIRFSSIGDILLTAPVIRELKEAGHHITFLVKSRFMSTALLLNGVDQVLCWEESSEEILHGSTHGFDRIIDLQGTAQSKRFTKKLRIPSDTYQKPYVRRALLIATKKSRYALAPVVERYAKAAGIAPKTREIKFKIKGQAQWIAKIVLVIGGTKLGIIIALAKDLAVSLTVNASKSSSLKCRCQSSGRTIINSFTIEWRYTIFPKLSS